MSDRVARVALSRLTEPGDLRLAGLVADLGAEEVYRHLRDERDVSGLHTDVAVRLRGLEPERDLAEAAESGIRFVVPGDEEWPAGLEDLRGAEPVQRRGGPPLGLWVRGARRLDESVARAVAVVGSRSATSYGADVARGLAADVAEAGVTVVSGAAFGIDQAAHRGALAARGMTIAVLACGVDRSYPAAHHELLSYIRDTGLVVSELPPGCSPTRLRFLARNRLIAALTPATVVVEAAARSGALNTANWAARLHRVVAGVPGPVTSAPSEGVHELIRSGSAQLVTRGSDVLELISPAGEHTAPPVRGAERLLDRLTEGELRVLDALPVRQSVSVSSLARTAGLAERSVRSGLATLEEIGLASGEQGLWRLAETGTSRV